MESFAEIKRTMFSGSTNVTHKTGDPEACSMIIDDDLDVIDALTSAPNSLSLDFMPSL